MITEEEVVDNFRGVGIVRSILIIESVRVDNFSRIIEGLKRKLFSPKITLLTKSKIFSGQIEGVSQVVQYKEKDILNVFNEESPLIKRLKEDSYDFIIILYSKKERLKFKTELLTVVLNAPYICEWNEENEVNFRQKSHYFPTTI
ncbi:hypothetical protein KJ693_01715 [bacterium]|nr:hypothetical protein [bacterium]MBU1614007.1 hypothetical protein [bacterium]